jgi:hypothetical protein
MNSLTWIILLEVDWNDIGTGLLSESKSGGDGVNSVDFGSTLGESESKSGLLEDSQYNSNTGTMEHTPIGPILSSRVS